MGEATLKIAILGATSEIAKDLILHFVERDTYQIVLFARNIEVVRVWLAILQLKNKFKVRHLDEFDNEYFFDVVINFIGVGNPAQASAMGASILDVTLKYDTMVLEYLNRNPACKYIFLSSGAVYGGSFKNPANDNVSAVLNINNLKCQDWYGIAKLHAECRHRALSNFSIVDIRVFNYFSHTQNMNSRFLITDIVRAICNKEILETSEHYMVRDFMHPFDFYQLIKKILSSGLLNTHIDCYTLEPVDKPALLIAMQERFDLNYKISSASGGGVNATGEKPFYYSLSRRAEQLGYKPLFTSLEGITLEINALLRRNLRVTR